MNTNTDQQDVKLSRRLIIWIASNTNLSLTIIFATLGIIAFVFQDSEGTGEEIPGGYSGENESEQVAEIGSVLVRDSSRLPFIPIQATLYANGDTSCASYYNTKGKRTKYIEKSENGDTVRFYETNYTDVERIDYKTEYHMNGRTCSKTRIINGEFDGEQVIYYETGFIKLKRTYSKGKETGACYYDKDGKLIKTGNNNKPI